MFCPQCGQRQASNEVRFCSSCGFALNVVTELLANGGQLPWRTAAQSGGPLSPRQKGIRQGALFMLSTVLVVPLLAILGVSLMGLPGQVVALAAVGLPIGGFLRILYALLLESNAPFATDFSARSKVMSRTSAKNTAAAKVSHIGKAGDRES